MSTFFDCPYLGRQVELTDEREAHIWTRHPDLMLEHRELIALTLAAPNSVHRSQGRDTLLFLRWYDDLRNYVLVIVVGGASQDRSWIVTARIARSPLREDQIWPLN